MKEISLSGNKLAIVDDNVFKEVAIIRWHSYKSGHTFYACHSDYSLGKKTIHMHRYIIEMHLNRKLLSSEEVDHINHNGLDNRLENLRIVTKSQQHANRIHTTMNKTSKYKGVSWKTERGTWVTQIKVRGKKMHLGYFTDEKEAAKAYNIAAKKYFGEFAYLNVV